MHIHVSYVHSHGGAYNIICTSFTRHVSYNKQGIHRLHAHRQTHRQTDRDMAVYVPTQRPAYAKALLLALVIFLPVFITRGAFDAKMSVAAVLVGLSSSRGRFLPTDAVS